MSQKLIQRRQRPLTDRQLQTRLNSLNISENDERESTDQEPKRRVLTKKRAPELRNSDSDAEDLGKFLFDH